MNLLNERETPLNLFMEKTSNFCKNIVNKIINIHSLFNDEQNMKLEKLRKNVILLLNLQLMIYHI